jgi:hypothetical protein
LLSCDPVSPCPQTLQPPISTFSPLAAPPLLQFGFSVAVDVDTVAIGCPGQPDAAKSNAPTGAVFVYDRSSDSNHYVYRQVRAGVQAGRQASRRCARASLSPPSHTPHTHSFPVQALLPWTICPSPPPPPLLLPRCPAQALFPTTALAFDRVGQGVAIKDNTITVTSGANFTGVTANLHPRFEVQQVRSTANSGQQLSGTFRLAFTRTFNKVDRGLTERGSGLGVREPQVRSIVSGEGGLHPAAPCCLTPCHSRRLCCPTITCTNRHVQ